jgi:N-methylhydantoinase A
MQSPPGRVDYSAFISADELNAIFDDLTERGRARLARAGVDTSHATATRFIEMRFRFQIHVLTVQVPAGPLDGPGVDAAVHRFIDAYEARFGEGSAFDAAGVELMTFRVVVKAPTVRPELRRASGNGGAAPGPIGERRVFQEGEWRSARIYDESAVVPGAVIDGLAVVELQDTTIVVGHGQRAEVDDYGSVVITLPAHEGGEDL